MIIFSLKLCEPVSQSQNAKDICYVLTYPLFRSVY